MAARAERPRIAVDLRALVGRPTGIGFFTLSLLGELAARGDFDYLGMAQAPVYGDRRLRRSGVELEFRSAPLGVIWQQLMVPRRMKRGDVDLFWSPILTLPVRVGVPAVVTVHDLTPVLFAESHSFKVKASFTPFIRPSVEIAKSVVADSEATARDLRAQFPQVRDKVVVVYPGVDPEFQPAAEGEIRAFREELDCPDGYILFAGTLEPRKNVGLLLEAWAGLKAADDSTPPLVIAGSYGWKSRRLLRRIRALERHGLRALDHLPRERLVKLIQSARMLVMPSLYEGFGLPAAEAMACAVPTLVSDSSSLPEVVGSAGLIFDSGDASALAAAIARVLKDPGLAAELSRRGPEQARRFSWRQAAEEMSSVFRRALASRDDG